MNDNYLNSLKKEFLRYKSLGERTMEQLSDHQLHKELSADSNSISIIVKHLVGNMKSRFTNFLTEDGEKPWRQRDDEFIDSYTSRGELLQAWEEGWELVFNTIEQVKQIDLETSVLIRNEKHSIIEAFNRQLAHYANHVGQIVILGKTHLGTDFKSLSIPKGKTEEFNKSKFSKGVH